MNEKIRQAAIKLFGKRRFEEIMGQLWLDQSAILARVDEPEDIYPVLLEWENRFKRDIEEGRYRVGRNRRHRVMRFSEMLPPSRDSKMDLSGADVPLTVADHVRKVF